MAKNTELPEIIERRLMQLEHEKEDNKVDGLVISHVPHVRYMTNFSGSNAFLFILPDKTYFVTDERYKDDLDDLYPLPNLEVRITRDPWTYMPEQGLLDSVKSIGFEADRLPYAETVEIRNKMRPIKFKPLTNMLDRYVQPKSEGELGNIKKACEILIKTYEDSLEYIKPGMTEKDLAIELSYNLMKNGSEGDPFPIIVGAGPHGAHVHGKPGDRKLRKTEILLIDIGARYNGFVAGITRTIGIGKVPKEQKDIYKVIKAAQKKAIDNILPGMKASYIDELARKVIRDAGYGEYFEHPLGHGFGLTNDEKPLIYHTEDEQMIPLDSVLAIEPGIYIPGKFGMRIEDNVLVTQDECVRLTDSPEELVVL